MNGPDPISRREFDALRADVACTFSDTKQVLDLLRGRIDDPDDGGLAGQVRDLQREVKAIKQTHTAAKRWALTAIGAAALSFAKLVWTAVTTGQTSGGQHP